MLGYGILTHIDEIGPVARGIWDDLRHGISTLGQWGLLLLFLRAYSLGGGTYTGYRSRIKRLTDYEEPKVKTGKRTMLYMSTSLALTAAAFLCVNLLLEIRPVEGRTLNAVLAGDLFGRWHYGIGLHCLLSCRKVLCYLWLPKLGSSTAEGHGKHGRRFLVPPSFLGTLRTADHAEWRPSDGRSGSSASALYPRLCFPSCRHVRHQCLCHILSFRTGYVRFFIKHRKVERQWKKHLPVHLAGLTLCLTILTITLFEKFEGGGWITLLITSGVIGICLSGSRSLYKSPKECSIP